MRNIIIIVLVSISFSFINFDNVVDHERENIQIEEVHKKTQLPYLAAFGDSIKIYDSPYDSSRIVGILHRFDSIPQCGIYLNKRLENLNEIYGSKWIGVEFCNDSCWVKTSDSISFEVDIEKFNQLIIQHRVHYVEIAGIGYRESQVIDTTNNVRITGSYISRKYSQPINDSLYLFIDGWQVKIFNTRQDSFIYNKIGNIPALNREYNQLYYLIWQEDSIGKYGYHYKRDIPCELVMYNYKTNKDTTIYKVESIEEKPYYWGPDYRYDTELKIAKEKEGNMVIEFELYRMNPNPTDYDDFIKSIIKVDILKNGY